MSVKCGAMKVFMTSVFSLMMLVATAQDPVKTVYYEDGQVQAEYSISEESVVWASFYYPNGSVREVGRYSNGTPDGFWQSWDENGRKICEAYYVDGVKDGKWLYWTNEGTVQYEVYYDDNEIIDYTQWNRADVVLED